MPMDEISEEFFFFFVVVSREGSEELKKFAKEFILGFG